MILNKFIIGLMFVCSCLAIPEPGNVNVNVDVDVDVGVARPGAKYKGPYSLDWTNNQCNVIPSLAVGLSIHECLALCDRITSCTAVSYWPASDSSCILRACPCPIPAPTVPTSPPYQGFSKRNAMFTGPFNNVWSGVCSVIRTTYVSLPVCMDLCLVTTDCAAIEFLETTSWCWLRGCPFPIPEPTLKLTGWNGYSYSTGFMFGPEWNTTTNIIPARP